MHIFACICTTGEKLWKFHEPNRVQMHDGGEYIHKEIHIHTLPCTDFIMNILSSVKAILIQKSDFLPKRSRGSASFLAFAHQFIIFRFDICVNSYAHYVRACIAQINSNGSNISLLKLYYNSQMGVWMEITLGKWQQHTLENIVEVKTAEKSKHTHIYIFLIYTEMASKSNGIWTHTEQTRGV